MSSLFAFHFQYLCNHFVDCQASSTITNVGGSGKKENDDKLRRSSLPEELAIFDLDLIDRIEADILSFRGEDNGERKSGTVTFDDIAGLDFAKKCVNELICW